MTSKQSGSRRVFTLALSSGLVASGLLFSSMLALAQSDDDLFYSGPVIDGPNYCLNSSFGGPTTYPFDSDRDGVADTCSLPRTRRAAAARQFALERLGTEQQLRLQALFIEECVSGPATLGEPDKEAEDECVTGTLNPPPGGPADYHQFYSGPIITDHEFCFNMSLGGPITFAFDSDRDGVADTCSLPRTRRAAAARQFALERLGTEHPDRFRDLLAYECTTGPYTLGEPDKEPDDECDPYRPQHPATFSAIAAGQVHSCALRTSQTIVCWGSNYYFQSEAPGGRFIALATNNLHSCAIGVDQAISCWGFNKDGQADAPEGRYTAIATGWYHSCALSIESTITCWGNNDQGQSDPPSGQFTTIAAGGWFSCALRADQSIVCWGDGRFGQTNPHNERYTAISMGFGGACGIHLDATISCWADNEFGQRDVPSGQYTEVSANQGNVCAIRVNGTITCWGTSRFGIPQPPSGTFTAVSTGRYHSCALGIDQSIVCWGSTWWGATDVPNGQSSIDEQ